LKNLFRGYLFPGPSLPVVDKCPHTKTIPHSRTLRQICPSVVDGAMLGRVHQSWTQKTKKNKKKLIFCEKNLFFGVFQTFYSLILLFIHKTVSTGNFLLHFARLQYVFARGIIQSESETHHNTKKRSFNHV
jgi:hypothetical protein